MYIDLNTTKPCNVSGVYRRLIGRNVSRNRAYSDDLRADVLKRNHESDRIVGRSVRVYPVFRHLNLAAMLLILLRPKTYAHNEPQKFSTTTQSIPLKKQ